MSRNDYRMIRKCRAFTEWRGANHLHFGGYLTPMEVIKLASMKEVTYDQEWAWQYILRKKKKGESNPSWNYFYSTNKELNSKIMEG